MDEYLRRIQFTGRSTYTISLPKEWVLRNNLDKKRIVRMVIPSHREILLMPPEAPRDEEIVRIIKLGEGESKHRVLRRVISYYLNGADVIIIRGEGGYIHPDLRRYIKEYVRKLLFGVELMEESGSEIGFHVLTSDIELPIKSIIRRMGEIAINMHRDTLSSLLSRDIDMLTEIQSRDDDVDRLYFLVIRLIKNYLRNRVVLRDRDIEEVTDLLEYRIVARHLERAADHATIIAGYMKRIIDKMDAGDLNMLIGLGRLSCRILEASIDALLNRNIDMAEETIRERNEVRGMEEEALNILFKYRDPEVISIIRLAIESLRRVSEYGAGISEIAINISLK